MTNRGPLAGLRVADFSRILAGPFATIVLSDLGMEIIKVERPGTGDDTRNWGPPWFGESSTYYHGLNRNKKSVVLNLEERNDRELAKKLAERSDVLVENFRSGTMQAWGLGYESVAEKNPQLVYCTISGFGSTGPGADLPGYDLLVQAMSGLMSITGYPDGPPTKVGVALIDMITGLYATTGILAALTDRDRTGRGAHVEVSLFEAAITSLLNVGSGYLLGGVDGSRRGNRHPSIAPYQTYRAKNGHLVLAVGSDKLWHRTCDILGRPDLKNDPAYVTNGDRVANIDRLERDIESILVERDVDDWVDLFRGVGVPAGPVNTVAEALALAEQLGCGPKRTADHSGTGHSYVASPIHGSQWGVPTASAAPSLGEQNASIRAWLADD